MNLINGKIIEATDLNEALSSLHMTVLKTLSEGKLDPLIVVEACNKLSEKLNDEHVELMVSELGIPKEKAERYLLEAKEMLCKDFLMNRIRLELGEKYPAPYTFISTDGALRVTEEFYPLGVLLHVTAGNQYGLAFYSVVEGLLCGNVNIVKLSSDDDGLSLAILMELIRLEPKLAGYIYLFNIPSSDESSMKKLYALADGVVVWGGNSAIAAIRQNVKPDTKLIEWGHKLSFAYVTLNGITNEQLFGLAEHIVETNQLLCSSCQGIFLDTSSMDDVYSLCERFLHILDECREKSRPTLPIAVKAATSLRVYAEEIGNTSLRSCRVFRGKNISIVAYEDKVLESSIPFGNCWIRRLPKHEVLSVLRPYKQQLQTVALVALDGEFSEIKKLLLQSGAVRITSGENMSKLYHGSAHDGEYSLRRYTRLTSVEIPITKV